MVGYCLLDKNLSVMTSSSASEITLLSISRNLVACLTSRCSNSCSRSLSVRDIELSTSTEAAKTAVGSSKIRVINNSLSFSDTFPPRAEKALNAARLSILSIKITLSSDHFCKLMNFFIASIYSISQAGMFCSNASRRPFLSSIVSQRFFCAHPAATARSTIKNKDCFIFSLL